MKDSEPQGGGKTAETKPDLRSIFRSIRRNSILSADKQMLTDDLHACFVASATAKCIDFNLAANRRSINNELGFCILSTLRGISEDLIVLRFLRDFDPSTRDQFLWAKLGLNVQEGIAAQREFFRVNNPLQPVLGVGMDDADVACLLEEARKKATLASAGLGGGRRYGPTIEDMARRANLVYTYRFIYFLTSNFVHFNPWSLLRTGWGPLDKGPFEFNLREMNLYYIALSRFYGSVLFIGFFNAFPKVFVGKTADLAAAVEDWIVGTLRWPEIITFEEMNKRPPLFVIFHALREVMREDQKDMPFGRILAEMKGLS